MLGISYVVYVVGVVAAVAAAMGTDLVLDLKDRPKEYIYVSVHMDMPIYGKCPHGYAHIR